LEKPRDFETSESMRLPLLDIRAWRRDPHAFATELRHACHRIGFFTLRHDLPPGLPERVFEEARRFFAQPAPVKAALDYASSPAFRGYMANGVENTAGKPDLREQVEIAAEGPPASAGAWPPYERLRGPNQWPASQPQLRACVDEYVEHMNRLSAEVTQALCLALGLDRNALQPRLFAGEPPHWQLKLASYEAALTTSPPAVGVGAHTDSGFLTLLLQDDAGGLQAYTQGDWADVPPAGLDVLVCNLGEVAEMVSGGYLLATPHRVLSSTRPRLSVPFFYNPALPSTIQPVELPAELPWEREREYDEQGHWRRPHNAMIHEYGANAFKSLARSHPAVFARHHPDLRLLEDGRVVCADGS
jgi:isopenicillin N synthase-like dioxygenase